MLSYFRNTVIFIGILTLVPEIKGRKVDTKKCVKPHGLFPKPGSFCKSYYRCTNWIPIEEECPFGQHFDAIHGSCEYAEFFPCFEKPPSKECLRPNGNFLKPGTGCKVYYQCCNGQSTEKICPGDQRFNPDAENCEWPNLYSCVENILSKDTTTNPTPSTPSSTKSSASTVKDYETSTTTLATTTDTTTEHDLFSTTSDDDIEKDTKTSTRFVYIYSSTDYIQTDSSTESATSRSTDAISTTQTNEYSDPDNQFSSTYDDFTVFSTTDDKINNTVKHTTKETSSPFVESSSTIIKTENTPSQTVTEIPSTTEGLDEIKMSTSRIWDIISSTVVNILCPEPNGYFPHPTNKHKFVGCVDGHPSVLECPEDLIYKHSIRACVYE
ncbi:uncharacterized protein LOC118199516 [Stegodyphus dumicola]|uniref:uncharacterized protein LOC118199516 n=1 Tax=Stegodyphus dumicola TaxID=202533 RepID=UPI0015ADDE8A|nr:uncharacterized protein LOC118199516 [Stegodyphus dumicola]